MDQKQASAPNYEDCEVQQATVQQRSQFVGQQKIGHYYVPSYALLSWLACIFCCWPLGIIAILKSNQVNSSLAANDIEGAEQASRCAKIYATIAILLGGFILIVIFLFTLTSSNIKWI